MDGEKFRFMPLKLMIGIEPYPNLMVLDCGYYDDMVIHDSRFMDVDGYKSPLFILNTPMVNGPEYVCPSPTRPW